VLNLNIANVGEGLKRSDVIAQPAEVDLDKTEEFHYPLHIAFNIEKIGRNIFINSDIRTKADFLCDRCGELFNKEMVESVRLIYTYDEHMADREDDDVYVISESTTTIDVSDPIRQTLLIAVPQKKLCQNNCKGLCDKCGANLNVESCDCHTDSMDPRWEALRNLIKE
jgi:uncharacterized protein